MNTTMKYLLFSLASTMIGAANCIAQMSTTTVSLNGRSSGGTITLMKAPAWNYPYVTVTNKPGESSASVLARLAQELTNCIDCAQWYGKTPVEGIKENSLVLYGSSPWIFGGTDTGFSIPPPPIGLTASYDIKTDQVTFEWINPPEGYDSIVIVYYSVPLVVLPGNATRYVHQRKGGVDAGFSSSDITVCVMGYKSGVPSNGVGVRLRRHVELECLMNVPFTAGTAPGFEVWTHNTPASALKFEQVNVSNVTPRGDVHVSQGKGFYQVAKGKGNFTGGMSRRFLGLTSGHKYRLSARLNTFDTKQGNWNFSFHAAHNSPNGENLTVAQLAGIAALPDGKIGSTAGQITKYDKSKATSGQWIQQSSENASSNNPAVDITLPEGINSITVWFRFEGTNVSDGLVGIDSITIEDIGR